MTIGGSFTHSGLEHQVALAPLTTLRVGGSARSFLTAHTEDDLIAAVAACDAAAEPLLLLGGGSNVVIGDDGFDGTVVKIATDGIEAVRDGDEVLVTVAAGEIWDRFVAHAVGDGWAGIETLSGIPGSVGATPIQNVGAYGREVSQVISHLSAFDRVAQQQVVIAGAECGFGYRSSRFKADPGRWVVLSVTLRLKVGGHSAPVLYPELADRLDVVSGQSVTPIAVRRAVLSIRRSKGMVLDIDDHDTWSVGSFFTNPIVSAQVAARVAHGCPAWPMVDGNVKLSAAWLIGSAGFEVGYPTGGQAPATLSTKHLLAVTNRGHATSDDVVALARTIRVGVLAATGVTLEPEPTFINLDPL